MSERPLTVYFDTCFWIWLATADDASAQSAIDSLNSAGVRYVLSLELVAELLRTSNQPENDRQLYKRVQRFEIPPLVTHPNTTWGAILLEGDEREASATELRNFQRQMSEAEATGWVANEGNERARQALVERSGMKTFDDARRLLKDQVGINIEVVTEEAQKLAGGELPSQQHFLHVVLQHMGVDPDDPEIAQMIAMAQQHRDLHAAVIGQRQTAQNIALGVATERHHRTHESDLRDVDHMQVFINNRDTIDLLQVDRAQYNRVQQMRPEHELRRLGLHDRVFRANSLEEAVDQVVRLSRKRRAA